MKSLILILLFVSACSSKPSMYKHGQYGDKQLSEDTYLVSYHGDSWGNEQEVMDMVFLRCSEIALKNGYPYFVLLDHNWKKETMAYNYAKVSEKFTRTNVIQLVLVPQKGKQTFDAKAIYSKHAKQLERDISSE